MSDNFLLSVSNNGYYNNSSGATKGIPNTVHINNNSNGNNNFLNNNNNNNNNNFDNNLNPPHNNLKKTSPVHPFGRLDAPKEYDLDLHKRLSPRVLDLPRYNGNNNNEDHHSSTGLDLSKFKPDPARFSSSNSDTLPNPYSKAHLPTYTSNPFFNSLTSGYQLSDNKSAALNGLTLNLSSNSSSKLSPSSLSSSLSSTSSSPMPLTSTNNNINNNNSTISRSNSVTGELGDTHLHRSQQLSSSSSIIYNRMDSITSNGYSASNSPDDPSTESGSIPNGDFLHQSYTKTHESNGRAGSNAKSPSDFLNNNNNKNNNSATDSSTETNNNNNNDDNNTSPSSPPLSSSSLSSKTTSGTAANPASSSSSSSTKTSSSASTREITDTSTTTTASNNNGSTISKPTNANSPTSATAAAASSSPTTTFKPSSSSSSSTTNAKISDSSTLSSSSSSLSSSHIAAKLMENTNYPKIPDAYSKILEEYGKASIGKFNDDVKMTSESFYDSFDSFPDSYSKQIEALANGYKSSKSPSSAASSKNVENLLSPGSFPKTENALNMSNGVFPKPEPSLTNGILGKLEAIPISSSPSQVLPSILNFSTNHLRGLASSESGLASYLNSFGMGGSSNPSSSSGNDNGNGRNSGSGGGVTSGGGASDGISRASPNNKLACRFCGKTFSQAGYIKAHERLHTGEKPFACSVCGKRFSDPSNWKKHERVHANTKKGHMDSRDAKVKNFFFKTMPSFMTSTLQHRMTFRAAADVAGSSSSSPQCGPVVCKLCGKVFSSQSSLSTHKRIHSGLRPYRCYSCGKSFTQIGTLRTHERTHTGQKPYVCKICGRTFAQSGSYRMHERRHITDSIQRCHVCYATFTSWQELQRHMASHPQVPQSMLDFDDGNDSLASKMENGPMGDDNMGQSGHGQDGDPSPRDVLVHNGPPGHPPPLIPESLLLETGDVPPFHAQAQGLYPSPGQLPPFSSILPFRPHPGVPPAFPPSFPPGLGLLGNQGMPVTSHAELMSKHSFFGALNMALGHQPPHLHLQDHHHHHHQQQLQQQHSSRMASSSSSSSSAASSQAQQQQHHHHPHHPHHHHQQQQQQQKKSPQPQAQKESPFSDGPEVVSTTSPRKNDLDFRSSGGNGGSSSRHRYSPEFEKLSSSDREKEVGGGMMHEERRMRESGIGGGVVFPRRYSYPEMRNTSSVDDVMMSQRRDEEMMGVDEDEEEREDGGIYGGIKRGGFRKGGGVGREVGEEMLGGAGVVKRVRSLEDAYIMERSRREGESGDGIKRRRKMMSVDDNNDEDEEDSNNARDDYYDDNDDDCGEGGGSLYRRKSARDNDDGIGDESDIRNSNNSSSGGGGNHHGNNKNGVGNRSSIFNRFKTRGGLDAPGVVNFEGDDVSDSIYNSKNGSDNNPGNNGDEEEEDNDAMMESENNDGGSSSSNGRLQPPAPPTRRHIEKQNLNTRMLSSSSSSTTTSASSMSSSSSSGRKQKHPMRRYSSAGNDHHHHHQQYQQQQQHHHQQQLDSPQSTSLPFSSITSTTDLLVEDREDKDRQSAEGLVDGGVEAEDRQMLEFLLKQGRVHKCQHCRIVFEDASLFLLHNGFHANLDPFECVVCHRVCKDRIEFNCHLTTHIK